ncbi:MAG TPA: HEAT repeat domain-containing protein [Polyangiaceae bacterium]
MSGARWLRRLACFCTGALCALSSEQAGARTPTKPGKEPSLLSELGVQAAERLLASDVPSERLRALSRLATLGSPRALELLGKALDPGGAARGAEEHLAAVRALAPHAKQPLAREALVRAMSSAPVEADSGPLSDWVRSAAALALSQTQDPLALAALGRALRKPGRSAELAKAALIANPPADLAPLLHQPGAPSKELCETLSALGDRRAEAFLRDVVRRAAPEARAAAALALMSLGSSEVLELSRHWLRSERQPLLVATASRILAQTGKSDAGPALEQLAGAEATRPLSLQLWLETDGGVRAPSALTPAYAGERAGALLELLARSGAQGSSQLELALADASTAGLSLYALSRVPGSGARQRLERALNEPRLRALALRALALRQARLADGGSAARSLARRLLDSQDALERAAAAFATMQWEPKRAQELLTARDAVVVRAAARGALRGEAALVAARRLVREQDPTLRSALAIALGDPAAAEVVPTPLLLDLIHDAGPGSLLAAAALSSRKDAELLPLIRELLTSGDPWLRAHALLGMARASDADVLGLLEGAYRFEPDASVRHAAIVALSHRAEPVKQRCLRLAAELDGDAAVRKAARLALAGHGLALAPLGDETVWLELSSNPGLPPQTLLGAQLRSGSGLALPALADPDGVVALAGVDPASVSIRLALDGDRVNVRGEGP